MDSYYIVSAGGTARDHQVAASLRDYERRGWVALEFGRYRVGFFIHYCVPDGGHWTVYERWKPAPPPPRGTRRRVSLKAIRAALALRPGLRLLTAFRWATR